VVRIIVSFGLGSLRGGWELMRRFSGGHLGVEGLGLTASPFLPGARRTSETRMSEDEDGDFFQIAYIDILPDIFVF